MSNYRRVYQQGGCYFFTLICYQRKPILGNEKNIQLLREAFKSVMNDHPFEIEAIVILPEHLHCIWNLPENDNDFSLRWRLIKNLFSRKLDVEKNERGEKLVWQRRFWEHVIRDEKDWKNHMNYIHYNPVKHKHVKAPADWHHSSFKKFVQNGFYDLNWGRFEIPPMLDMDLE
jgi:putative transposase